MLPCAPYGDDHRERAEPTRVCASDPPLERVLTCPEVCPDIAAQLQRQRDGFDPFVLARTIEQKLERIYALANPRHRSLTEPTTPVPVRGIVRQRPRLAPRPSTPLAPGNISDGAMTPPFGNILKWLDRACRAAASSCGTTRATAAMSWPATSSSGSGRQGGGAANGSAGSRRPFAKNDTV
jgi:hypothetical protein